MVEHTKWPWGIFYLNDGRPHMIQSRVNGVGIGTVFTHNENLYANANLIAAAPELLAMLEEVLPHLEDYFGKEYGDDPPENDLLERASAVIAKARGE